MDYLTATPIVKKIIQAYDFKIFICVRVKAVYLKNGTWLQLKAAFTESPYLRICVKKYGYAYKNTLMGMKFLLSLVSFILLFTEHAYLRMRISACVFLRLAKNKIRTRYAYFSGFYKDIFLRCDVTRLLSVVVMILVFETFNLSSVLTKIKTFIFAQT